MSNQFTRPEGTGGKSILGSDNKTPPNDLEKNALGNLDEDKLNELAKSLFTLNNRKYGPIPGAYMVMCTKPGKEWCVAQLNADRAKPFIIFEDKAFSSIKEAQEEAEKQVEGLTDRVKTVLGDKVKDVKFTHRLTDSPACIVADENGMTTQMAKLMQAAGQPVPETQYHFELNPEHQLVKILADIQDEDQFGQWAEVLFDQAALSEQGSLKDPASFVQKLNSLLMTLAK